jgi:hypothetical protein
MKHLLVLDALDSIGQGGRVRKSTSDGGPNSLRDFIGIRWTPIPLFDLELDGAPANRVVGARHDDGNAGGVCSLDHFAKDTRISGLDEDGSNAGVRHDCSSQFRRCDALGAPSVQLLNCSINCLLI